MSTIHELGAFLARPALGDTARSAPGPAEVLVRLRAVAPDQDDLPDGPLVALRPTGLDAVHAGAIPQSGLIANSLVRVAALRAGESILVIGAAGDVGVFVVGLAAAEGADVLATASDADRGYVLSLGASEVLDCEGGVVAVETLRRRPDGVDAVIDVVHAGTRLAASTRAMRSGARLVSPLNGPDAAGLGRDDIMVAYAGVGTGRHAQDLDTLGAGAAAGELPVEVGGVYPLDEAAKAFAASTGGRARGKVVIATDPAIM